MTVVFQYIYLLGIALGAGNIEKLREAPFQQPFVKHLMIDPVITARSTNSNVYKIRPASFQKTIEPNKPWEGNHVSFTQVIPDGKDGYRMYYFTMDHAGRRFVNLAISKDGIKWQKPDLGVIEYNGSKSNNIVIADIFEYGDIFRYPNNASGQYYIMLMLKDYRHYHFISTDGIRFQKSKDPVMDYCADTQNQAFYDPNKQRYVFYLRSFYLHPSNNEYYRTVSYFETKDPRKLNMQARSTRMKRWGPALPPAINDEVPRVMSLDYTQKNNLDKDIYTPAVIPEEQQYLAFPSIYYYYDTLKSKFENDGVLYLNLYYSKNGTSWHNYGTYIDSTQLPGYHQLYMGSGVIRKGDLNYHYLAAEKSTHGVYTTYSCIFRIAVEKDRYAALRSGNQKAITTLPLATIDFRQVELNFKTLNANGSVRVQVFNNKNQIIGDSGEMKGNELTKKVTWNTGNTTFRKGSSIKIIHAFSDLYSIKYQ